MPKKKTFFQEIQSGRIVPLYAEIPFASPDSVYETLISPNSVLLESVKGPDRIARYSFIGFDPCLTFKVKGGLIELDAPSKKTAFYGKPLTVLKEILHRYKQYPHDFLPPFQGGFAGMLSYEFAHYLEKLPLNTKDDLHIPDAHLLLFDRLLAFDHMNKKSWIIYCPGLRFFATHDVRQKSPDWSVLYDEAAEEMQYVMKRIRCKSSFADNSSLLTVMSRKTSAGSVEMYHALSKKEYIDMVIKAQEYIAAGDIFQANLSQRFSSPIMHRQPWDLYRLLRFINPSPFAAFVDYGEYHIVSSSPERLVRIRGNTIETRPIAGTRPRGKNSKEDAVMREELLLNEKERAEHIMLIDLERNDLGRISAYGSVHVDEFMITEDYSHVMHIVSNITGRLADGKDCFDAIRATFPGGTITGVPKVRCMEIIDELENLRRGPYTGSLGYIGLSGAMDFNIIIRTIVIKDGLAYVQAGAGIVADSDPVREYAETLKKAEALMKAIDMC